MKIGVIRQRYAASGGAERYLQAIICGLADRGHQLHLFAHRWTAPAEPRVHFHRVPMIRLTGMLRALSFAWNARKAVDGAGLDLVFSLERTLRQDVYRAGDGCHCEWLKQRRAHLAPARALAVALNPFHAAMLALEKRTLSPGRTRRVIAISNRGRDEIIRHFGFPAERITVVYPGVDLEQFQPRSESPGGGEVGLLFVGSGFERKGLRFCLQALARLPAGVRLRVVGKGNLVAARQLADALGVGTRVDFLGFDLEAATVYRNGAVLVHPAIYEPFSNACLEALACGLPVVTSRMTGASELIEHGVNGAIVEHPEDTGQLAHAIGLFLDPARLAAARVAARQTAEAHPFERNVRETLDVLEMARGPAR